MEKEKRRKRRKIAKEAAPGPRRRASGRAPCPIAPQESAARTRPRPPTRPGPQAQRLFPLN
eukprot:3933574-Rhodomonas_salina.1